MNCEICGDELRIRWSDSHGVGVCLTCGLPYTILHYEHGKAVEKPPEVAIKPEWVAIGKRYWEETKSRVFPGSYDVGFLGGRDTTYSGASREDLQKWEDWLSSHEDDLPKPKQEGR